MLKKFLVASKELVSFLKILGNNYTYRIVDDDNENIFYLQSKLSRSVLKLEIKVIVNNSKIVLGLPPAQACYIGYKYGEKIELPSPNIALEARYGKYKIIAFERSMIVKVMDLCDGKVISLSIMELLITKKMINNMDSTQAFHIGFIAGKFRVKLDRNFID